MPPERLRPRTVGRLARCAGVAAVLAVAAAVSGCAISGGSGSEDAPPRISPSPQSEVAAAMIESRGAATPRLDACALLDLSTSRVAALTGTDLPDVDPTGTGDLSNICTYGGPGSPERLAAESAGTEEGGAAVGSDGSGESESISTAEPTTTTTTTTRVEEGDAPDTVAAGVVKPRGKVRDALAEQPTMLSARYACSEIRGDSATTTESGATAGQSVPAPVTPDLDSAYIDCVAAPTGGGIEVHTILVADNDLWHVTVVRPGTARSAATEADALAGAHEIGVQILN